MVTASIRATQSGEPVLESAVVCSGHAMGRDELPGAQKSVVAVGKSTAIPAALIWT